MQDHLALVGVQKKGLQMVRKENISLQSRSKDAPKFAFFIHLILKGTFVFFRLKYRPKHHKFH